MNEQKGNTMKVVLIPGPRDEELIEEMLEAKSRMDGEEWEEYMLDCASRGEEYMDAIYYICENGDEMLEEQAQYFENCLLGDESAYYVARMGGFLDSMCC
ncbi:MAG: hypothetical protein ACI4O4_03595 [Candidatus Ventricola sp.]